MSEQMNTVPNVLIVEDEMLVALDLEDILSSGGFDVVGIVADQESATAIDKAPQVALVDLNLRDGPTGNAIAKLLASTYGTRIIYVTANPAQIANPPATTLGYVQKPFQPDTVLQAVRAAVHHGTPTPIGLRPVLSYDDQGSAAN